MTTYTVQLEEEQIFKASNEETTEYITVTLFRFPWTNISFCTKLHFAVHHRMMDGDCWDKIFTDFDDLYFFLQKEISKKNVFGSGKYRREEDAYTEIKTSVRFEEYVEDLEEDGYDGPSATNGDYGPSNPWDAPGMSISDFIPGVIIN